MSIEFKQTKKTPKNPLNGAVEIAIKKAEQFGTTLVIKGKNGKIREVSPKQMRRLVEAKA